MLKFSPSNNNRGRQLLKKYFRVDFGEHTEFYRNAFKSMLLIRFFKI